MHGCRLRSICISSPFEGGSIRLAEREFVFLGTGADSDVFSQKFFKARTLNTQFLKAYWEVRQAQEAMMAQLGLSNAEFDSSGTH